MTKKYEIQTFEELSAKVGTTLEVSNNFRLTALVDGKTRAVKPSAWKLSRDLPAGLTINDDGYIVGNVGDTAFLRKYTVRIEEPESESVTVGFAIKITKDVAGQFANEIVGGKWQDYSHVRIKESGSTAGIQNDWKMLGMNVAHAVTGVSGSFEMMGLRTDIAVQGFRLSVLVQGVSASYTTIGSRDAITSIGRSHSRSTTVNDTQINQITGDRFAMIDPPVVDVELNVMEPAKYESRLWEGGSNYSGWTEFGKNNWVQINEGSIGAVDFERLKSVRQFNAYWPLMSNMAKNIDELNLKIPGLDPHFPPLSSAPMELDDMRKNNGSARLVVRGGFSQLFHIHSEAGRSFYFAPTTSYYLAAVRTYYDELNQTIGNHKVLVRGGSYHHYNCLPRLKPLTGEFAGWDIETYRPGPRPDAPEKDPEKIPGDVISVYEGNMHMRTITMEPDPLQPKILNPKRLASFSMTVANDGCCPKGQIEFNAKEVLVKSSYDGANWGELLVGSDRSGEFIHLTARRGEVKLDANTIYARADKELSLHGFAGSCSIKLGENIRMTSQSVTVNGRQVQLAP